MVGVTQEPRRKKVLLFHFCPLAWRFPGLVRNAKAAGSIRSCRFFLIPFFFRVFFSSCREEMGRCFDAPWVSQHHHV